MLEKLAEPTLRLWSAEQATQRGWSRSVLGLQIETRLHERVIRERTLAGLAAARARGRMGGRPKLMNETQVAMAKAMLAARELPVREAYEAHHVSPATLCRYLAADRIAAGERPSARTSTRHVPRRGASVLPS